jgi:prevent-host-death family protein
MYTVHQAKNNFSRLLQQAEAGEEVIIARGKRPVARLVAIRSAAKKRVPGKFKHLIKVHRSFYEPMSKDEFKEWGID